MSEENIVALVGEKLAAADKGDLFALLGVASDATRPVIQKSYFALAKKLHPDRLANQELGDLTADAPKVFKALSEAYNTLMDDAKRAKHAAKASRADDARTTQVLLKTEADDPSVTAKEAAKIFYHKGMMMMKKGAFADAERLLQRAHEADSENARFALQLGWAIFQSDAASDPGRLKEARRLLELAVKVDEANPEAHYFIARYWKAVGKVDLAKSHLQKALKLRENYIEVKRELRLMEMRKTKSGSAAPAKGKGKGKSGSKTAKPEEGGRWPFGLDKLFKRK